MTTERNIVFGLKTQKSPRKMNSAKAVAEVIELVGLKGKQNSICRISFPAAAAAARWHSPGTGDETAHSAAG